MKTSVTEPFEQGKVIERAGEYWRVVEIKSVVPDLQEIPSTHPVPQVAVVCFSRVARNAEPT